MTEAARVAPARRMVRDLLRLLSLREIEPAAFDRLVEAIEHLEEGHTGARVTGESFPEALVGRESCEGKPFVLRDGVLRTARIAAYEETVEHELRARLSPRPRTEAAEAALERLFPIEEGTLAEIEPRRAAETVLDGGISFIVGGPGRGKTYTLKLLLAVLFEEAEALGRPLPRVMLAAPTGKAAARMREAIGEKLDRVNTSETIKAALRALEAKTLHRLLRITPDRALERRKPAPRPVEADVVVVDEASMIDLPLFARLLSQVPREARLVLLGDPDQLASVGVGSVLGDIVASDPFRDEGVPGLASRIARLTVSHRFGAGSGIGRLAAAIVDEDPDAVETILRSDAADLHFYEGERARWAALREAVVAGFTGVRAALDEGTGPEHLARALEAFDAHRVLALTYDGPFGVDGLNARAAAWLAEAGLVQWHDEGECSIHPVLVTENDPETGLLNGDVGLVITLEGRRVAVFPDLDAGVRVHPAALLPAHVTAFAMTVHKAQGSQFDHVSLVFPEHESRLGTRELFYTGVTRAKTRLSVHGDIALLRSATARRERRVSGLRERLHPRRDP